MVRKNFIEHAWPVLCNTTEIYDPLTDSWTTGAQMPDFGTGFEVASKSERIDSAVLDNKIYAIVDTSLHIYDTEADVWSYGADLLSSIKGATACATTGSFAPKRLRFLGLDAHYIYDLSADVWASAAPILASRYSVELGGVDDILYAIGGVIGDPLGIPAASPKTQNTNEGYTPLGYIPEFHYHTFIFCC